MKKTVRCLSLGSLPLAMRPACRIEFTLKEQHTCWGNLYNNSVANQLSSEMTLDGANMREIVVRVYAILKSGFVASSVHMTVLTSETKNPNELLSQFLDHQVLDVIPMLSIFSRFPKRENTSRHYLKQDTIPLLSADMDELFRWSNSSESIVPVASTHEFPQCLTLLGVIAQRLQNSPCQRLEENLLGRAKIHPRSGLGLWISQFRSKIRFSTYAAPVCQFHKDEDNI